MAVGTPEFPSLKIRNKIFSTLTTKESSKRKDERETHTRADRKTEREREKRKTGRIVKSNPFI